MRTLSEHGVAWRFRGFPIYAERESWDDEPPVIGYMDEPKWVEADLTPDHWDELAEWFAQDRADFDEAGRDLSDARLLFALMDRNGIEHEHVRGRPIYEHRPAYGYECAMCDSYIVFKDPGDFRFRGGPADGRWLVTDGSRYWHVPVPQPVSVMAADESPSVSNLSMGVATYRRVDDQYWFVS